MYEQKGKQSLPVQSLDRPGKEIDLHIEKISKNFTSLDNAEILQLQLKTFEHNLESAIATGMEEIIFIHGVGNGILKNQIHKLLSSNKNIKFFKDAQKEKFGYGATLVRLR
jgi:dsDNA-specific endonuclease/ATPase MutS2